MDWSLCGNILMRNWISFSESSERSEPSPEPTGLRLTHKWASG